MRDGYKSLMNIRELSKSYDIPLEDALFIDMNRKGVVIDTDYERIRFYFRLSDDEYFEESRRSGIKDFFFAMPTHSGISNYYQDRSNFRSSKSNI